LVDEVADAHIKDLLSIADFCLVSRWAYQTKPTRLRRATMVSILRRMHKSDGSVFDVSQRNGGWLELRRVRVLTRGQLIGSKNTRLPRRLSRQGLLGVAFSLKARQEARDP
jgi:hypothetical protein